MDKTSEEGDQTTSSEDSTGVTSEEEYQLLGEVGCVFSEKRREKLKTSRQGTKIQKEPSKRIELERRSSKEDWCEGLKSLSDSVPSQCMFNTWRNNSSLSKVHIFENIKRESMRAIMNQGGGEVTLLNPPLLALEHPLCTLTSSSHSSILASSFLSFSNPNSLHTSTLFAHIDTLFTHSAQFPSLSLGNLTHTIGARSSRAEHVQRSR